VASKPSGWATRYPDLAGKTMIVAGESSDLLETVRALASNSALLAIVAPSREIVQASTAIAETYGATVFGMTVDPSSPAVWERITQHIEQRLGPIDVVVAIAAAPTRRVIADALLPDMTARGHGVLIEAGATVQSLPTSGGVRHRALTGGDYTAGDLAAAVLLCASDTLTALHLTIAVSDSQQA
jgi:NAD(P)-dependent dehydrogenase (short-subunit alcohol dehydrogenase family)